MSQQISLLYANVRSIISKRNTLMIHVNATNLQDKIQMYVV